MKVTTDDILSVFNQLYLNQISVKINEKKPYSDDAWLVCQVPKRMDLEQFDYIRDLINHILEEKKS